MFPFNVESIKYFFSVWFKSEISESLLTKARPLRYKCIQVTEKF